MLMNAAPLALYALARIRDQELDRRARSAWQRQAREAPQPGPVVRQTAVHLDTVAQGC
jgi:hypothetical protein